MKEETLRAVLALLANAILRNEYGKDLRGEKKLEAVSFEDLDEFERLMQEERERDEW